MWPKDILKGVHIRTIPAKFALIWFSGFRGKDLNVILYQNISLGVLYLYQITDFGVLKYMNKHNCFGQGHKLKSR